jgi:hypothetical protein
MKNFTYKALAVATAAVCGAGAQAGTVASTPGKYAVEAITSTSAITLSPVVYTMGVGRVISQPFTIIVREPAGATTTLSCGAVPTVAGGGAAANVTVKRTSPTECVWDVNVTADVVVNSTITFPNLAINGHGLATVGATEKLNFALYDTGETARVDNSNDITATVATSGRAITLTATQDTNTKADVNFNGGNQPLFGFVANGDDTTTNAAANFTIGVNGTLLNATGAAVTANSILTNIVVTIAGDFSGLNTSFSGAGNSSVQVNATAPVLSTPQTVTYNATTGTAVFTVSPAALTQNGTTNVLVSLNSSVTQSLGTARTFGVSAVANPSLAGVGAQALAGNASWWVWGANGIELRSAFFNNFADTNNFTRFFFQNTGSQMADYSATCQAETGKTVTYGAAKSGKLAVGTTALNAADICTFSTGTRGSITFTINANIGVVKGVFQQAINGAAAGYIPLERPYGANTY